MSATIQTSKLLGLTRPSIVNRHTPAPFKHYCTPHQIGIQRQRLVLQAVFDFASTQKVTGRRNRSQVRREKFQLLDIIKTLCQLTAKQLKSVSHLLTEEQIKAVKLASSLDRTNPARSRQESLVAKLVRVEFDDDEIKQLGETVELAMANKLASSPESAEQQDLVDRWVQGILDGDESVMDELFKLPAACNLDGTQLRQLARQCQQHQQQQQEATASSTSSSLGSHIEFVQDPELLELLAQRQKQQSKQQQSSKKKQSPTKQLRKFLAGPAKQVLKLQQEGSQE